MTVTTHPRARYMLRLANGDQVDVLPTSMLLDQFGRIPVVEAYEQEPASDQYPAIWRMRDDKYDRPGTEYTVVREIRRVERATCGECDRVFDLLDTNDANEWNYGHDCEVAS